MKFDRLACCGHDMNLAIKFGLLNSDTRIIELDKAAKTLVDHCKRTSIGHKLQHRLIVQCETRWNTHWMMYNSILNNWDQLVQLLTERDELNYIISMSRSLLEAVSNILKPFNTATELISAEMTPTLNLVIPMYEQLQLRLEKSLKKRLNDGADCLRRMLLQGLQDKCVSKLTWWHVAACLLDPVDKV